MAPLSDNGVLLLSVGLSACSALVLMRYMLDHYRDTVEVEPTRAKTQYITQKTEDSLKISTLQKLFESDSYSVKETAARIVCDRAMHDSSTLNSLVREISKPDYGRRDRGIRAMLLLSERFGLAALHKRKSYEALVTCLSHCLNDVEHDEFELGFDSFHFRDAVERNALYILAQLVSTYGLHWALKAGFVDRWLVKQPWGKTPMDIRLHFSNYSLLYYNDLTTMMREIQSSPEGHRQLQRVGLIPDHNTPAMEGLDIDMVYDEAVQGLNQQPSSDVEAEPRRREQSEEEERVRRRHREAMVFNDGVEPLGRDDIFQREDENGNDTRFRLGSPVADLWGLEAAGADQW